MADDTILSLAADIVTAHVGHNRVGMGDLPTLIQSVYGALTALGQDAPVAEEPRAPAVSIRASIRHEVLTCLDCGKKAKLLKRHIATEHGQTPTEYRARWNLPADYPMVTAEYAARRKELALHIGLGRKPRTPIPVPPVTATAPAAAKKAAPKRTAASANAQAAVPAAKPAAKPKPKADPAPAKRKKLGIAVS